MSDWGSRIDALETLVRTALGDLATGDDGFERRQGFGESLSPSQVPHVFAHSPTEEVDEDAEGYAQGFVAFRIQLDVWVRNETLEELSTRLDAIRDAVDGDRTLSALVEWQRVSARGVRDFKGQSQRLGIVVVEMVWID